MLDVQTCPSLEDIAAFLDGRVNADERARLIRHLADCPTCLEVLAGAAQFLASEEAAAAAAREDAARQGSAPEPAAPTPWEVLAPPPGAPGSPARWEAGTAVTAATAPTGTIAVAPAGAAADAPPAPLLPFRPPDRSATAPGRSASASARVPRSLGYGLAAAAIAITIGVPGYFLWQRAQQPPTSAALVKELTGYPQTAPAQGLAGNIYAEPRFRGSSPSATTSFSYAQEFMLGVDLLDFRIALEADDRLVSADKARHILSRISETAPSTIAFYRAAIELQQSRKSPRDLLAESNPNERKLEPLYPDLAVGRWVEAARLAALAGRHDFFRSRVTRRSLDQILNQQDEPLEPETRAVLADLRQRIEHDDLADLKGIAGKLEKLIESNERKSRSEDNG